MADTDDDAGTQAPGDVDGRPGGGHAGAGGHPPAGAGTLATTAKKTDHKTAVIVVVSVVGVIIAWMTFRKSGSSTSPAGAVTAPAPSLGLGQVAGTSDQTTTNGANPPADATAVAGLQAYLMNMEQTLTTIAHNTTPTGASTATPIPSQHAPTPLPHPPPSSPPRTIQPTPKPTQHNYTVQHGDNLTNIAQHQGVTLAALETANPQIKNPNLIYAGQNVTVPK